MKIVLTDAQTVVDGLVSAERLSEFGEVEQYGLLRYDEVAEKIADADMVICNKTLMDAGSLRLAHKLRYIGLFATGYNNIDIPYCREHGITVCNAGSYSTSAVAQHTFALILEHYNKVSMYNTYVAEGRWKRSPTFSPFVYPLNELSGKTLGIVGLGAIGQAVAGIARVLRIIAGAAPVRADKIDLLRKPVFRQQIAERIAVAALHPESVRDRIAEAHHAQLRAFTVRAGGYGRARQHKNSGTCSRSDLFTVFIHQRSPVRPVVIL